MSSLNKLFYWYFSKKAVPYWTILLIDCAITFMSLLVVYVLNSSASAALSIFGRLVLTICVYLVFFVIGFRWFSTYSGVLRYSSFTDLQRVGLAVMVGIILSAIFKYTVGMHDPFVPFRMRDLLLGGILAMLCMWGIRVLVKHIYETLNHMMEAINVFIFGVREGGIAIAKSIRSQEPSKYVLSGFTSDANDGPGRMLMGVKVYPFDMTLLDAMKAHNAKGLFVSPLRAKALRDNPEIVDALVAAGIKIFMMPVEQEWDGKTDIAYQMMHEVEIEDLLPREQIDVNLETIAEHLTGTRILISGAAGSIGSEIVRQVALFKPSELILIDQAETQLHDIRLMMRKDFPDIKAETIVVDITHRDRMERIFLKYRPEYVFHAAAYKHVPMMEDNPAESIINNVEGTKILADLAVVHGTKKFVMISTDKAVNPTNVMGCSKRICEIYVQSLDKAIKDGAVDGVTQFVTTRFGNVLGSNGSVVPLFRRQIKDGGPITVTHPDIIRYFMLIPEACKLVLEAGTMGRGGEIFVFDMGEPVKIVDLARRMIRLSGTNCEIKFTGLRDGEKLYEEVLNDKETTLPTFHPKIQIAKVREYDYVKINDTIIDLINIAAQADAMEIVGHMKAIVPEFKSQHSVYEVLDK